MLKAVLCAASLVAAVFLASPSFGLDNENDDLGDPGTPVTHCVEKGGTVEQPEGSPIKACCLDGLFRGCYICNSNWQDCVWDNAYRKVNNKLIKLKVAPKGTMAPSQ